MLRRLGCIVVVAFCVTTLAQQTSLGSLLFGDECSENCPDDIAPHHCPPGCTACNCVAHGNLLGLVPQPPAPESFQIARVERHEPAMPLDPYPDPIFHVPKPTVV